MRGIFGWLGQRERRIPWWKMGTQGIRVAREITLESQMYHVKEFWVKERGKLIVNSREKGHPPLAVVCMRTLEDVVIRFSMG